MIGLTKKVAVLPLQSEANATYNPFPNDTTNVTDIQAIKTAFLADQDILAALKGADGQTGQQGPQGPAGITGPAGDSVIVRDTDPTDLISSKVGDLYLNTTTGTLYQRSGITQSQFYAAGLQGIVLPNSIWITKGNLKGATGQKGDKGDKGEGIISGFGHPIVAVETLPPVGTLYINKNTFVMYERRATEYIPGTVPGQLPEDYTLGYWYSLGSLKGPQGNEGQVGPAGNSIMVGVSDPTDEISSKVGDLYLNTTSGTLYQRSGLTQSQFFASGLQGLVLPNSIWVTKGNLKGPTGAKGETGATNIANATFGIGEFNVNGYAAGGNSVAEINLKLPDTSRYRFLNLNDVLTFEHYSSTGVGLQVCKFLGDGTIQKIGGGSFAAISDERLKKEITPFTSGLDKILSIEPKMFKYNAVEGTPTENYPQSITDKQQYGIIAQELQTVCPEMVSTDEAGFLSVDLSNISLLLINAIKQQQILIEGLTTRVIELETTKTPT